MIVSIVHIPQPARALKTKCAYHRKLRQRFSLGGANQTQPVHQLPHRRRQNDHGGNVDGMDRGTAGSDAGSYYRDDLTEGTDNPPQPRQTQHRLDNNSARFAAERSAAAHRGKNNTTRATKTAPTTSRRPVSPPAVGPPAAHHERAARYRQPRTKGGRPREVNEYRPHADHGYGYDDDKDYDGTENLSGSRATARAARLVATAPAAASAAASAAAAATTAATAAAAAEAEEPRYSAARVAGEMSARAYHPHRNGHGGTASSRPWREQQQSSSHVVVEKGRAATVRPVGSQSTGAVSTGAGRGAGHRQRQRGRGRRFPGGGVGRGGKEGRRGSSSDVSVSSCGDMTISSEEQEGEEMAYTG